MPSCPWCDVALTRVIGVSGLRHTCPACGSAAFDRDVAERTFARDRISEAWHAARSAEPISRLCPFCGDALASPADGVSVCRECEMLWLDAGAMKRLPRPADAVALAPRCPHCGAPWVASSDGTCRCCHGVPPVVLDIGEHARRASGPSP